MPDLQIRHNIDMATSFKAFSKCLIFLLNPKYNFRHSDMPKKSRIAPGSSKLGISQSLPNPGNPAHEMPSLVRYRQCSTDSAVKTVQFTVFFGSCFFEPLHLHKLDCRQTR